MKRTAPMRAALVLVAAASTVAGCGNAKAGNPAPTVSSVPAPDDNGVSAVDPATLADRAELALRQATSYHIKGATTDDGMPLAVDVKVHRTDLAGTITLGTTKMDVVAIQGKDYIRTDEAGWMKLSGGTSAADVEKSKAGADLFANRWVLVPSDGKDGLASFFDVTRPDQMLELDGTLTGGPSKRIDGIAAVSVVDADGAILYVATTGRPYPLRLEEKPGSADELTFSEFDQTFPEIKAPPSGDVIDLAKLGA